MYNSVVFKDKVRLLNEIKKKYYPSKEVFHDMELLKIVFRRLGVDTSDLEVDAPYNDYKFDLLDKKEVTDYYKYCDFIDKNYETFLKCAKSYTDLLRKNHFLCLDNFSCSETYTMNEMVNILLNFYASLGEEEYDFALKYFKEQRIFLSPNILDDENIHGQCLCTRHLGGSYIFIKYDKKIDLSVMMNLVHELGHAYELEKLKGKYNRYNLPETKHTVEISSIFYQLQFLRYLQKNKINTFETNGLINYIYSWAGGWNEELLCATDEDVIVENDTLFTVTDKDEWFITADYEFARLFRMCDENYDITDKALIFSVNIDDDILYGNGSYIAFHLDELRKQDPKEFKKLFDKVLTMRTIMGYNELVQNMGLDYEEFLSGKLIEPQIKKDQEVFKRQYKIK